MNRLALCGSLLMLPALAVAALKGPQKPSGREIHVDVNLVGVLVSVLDSSGRPVLDLTKDAFSLSEEGVAQKIDRFEAETNRPLDLVLMMDTSLSEQKELKFEAEAAAHFIRQVVRPGDSLSVFEFSDTVTQLSDFSADVPMLQAAVRRILPGAGTAMYDAVFLGAQALRRRPAERRRAIVLVTDAGETTSIARFEDVRRTALASGALLYGIIIRPVKSENGRNTAGEHALETIAGDTGGAMYYPDSISQLDAMFDRIDRELRTQYLLGYYPEPRPAPGMFRRIEVRVKGDYLLHFRKGYFAPETGAP